MLSAFQNAFKIPDLRKRIIFTALLLLVLRVGAHITIPGIDDEQLSKLFDDLATEGGILQLYDLFAGRAFSQMTIFALGIQPYISASIILQLLTVVIPYLERLSKQGPTGQKKITQYTRYGTVVLAAVQGIGISAALRNPGYLGVGNIQVIHQNINPIAFTFVTVITLMAGTTFVMWLGEQITERGIGNGISLIIFANIVARIPNGAVNMVRSLFSTSEDRLDLARLLIFLVVVVAIIMGVIFITLGTRKIPVQYARRVVGRKVYGGQTTHLPLRVNQAGVIPVIFAITIISFPTTLGRMIPSSIVQDIVGYFGRWPLYHILYAVLIIFFTYFYTAVTTNPVDLADNMKKYGGFIPGIRPGKSTAEYIDRALTRITLVGALFLAAVALLPYILQSHLGVPISFGGTPLLIVVGVGLDTMQQIESHLIMRHYEGFLKGGKLRSRRR
ncbi:preprotein translocase subunit SecY [Candidatus Poribacteria bacterium]|nr:preprotein translocase subunit SecY [Candidatus Poribacteria bacterium]